MAKPTEEDFLQDVELIKEIANNFNIDYCPVNSVLGSIISQEVVSLYEKAKIPALNWLFYDSYKGQAEVVTLQPLSKI